MMKKILTFCMICSILLIPSTAFAATGDVDSTVSAVTNGTASPNFMYTYTKTVINYYSSYSSIPSSIDYPEYSNTWGWCYGTLYLKSVVSSGSGWNATFTGTMYASNQ
jgi:hypothetical protein